MGGLDATGTPSAELDATTSMRILDRSTPMPTPRFGSKSRRPRDRMAGLCHLGGLALPGTGRNWMSTTAARSAPLPWLRATTARARHLGTPTAPQEVPAEQPQPERGPIRDEGDGRRSTRLQPHGHANVHRHGEDLQMTQSTRPSSREMIPGRRPDEGVSDGAGPERQPPSSASRAAPPCRWVPPPPARQDEGPQPEPGEWLKPGPTAAGAGPTSTSAQLQLQVAVENGEAQVAIARGADPNRAQPASATKSTANTPSHASPKSATRRDWRRGGARAGADFSLGDEFSQMAVASPLLG